MKRLLYASPTYGPVMDPCIDKNHRAAIMFAANNGVQWIGDASPDRLGWAAARNKVAEAALEAAKTDEVDGVFWNDDDIMMPVEAIQRLSSYDLDFVSGLYFQREFPHWPVAAVFNGAAFHWWSDIQKNVIVPCDGVGFGCVYTSINLLRKMSALDEVREHGFFGGDFGNRTYGEDFVFCLRAAKVGIRPHVDTAVLCKHASGLSFATAETFAERREEAMRLVTQQEA